MQSFVNVKLLCLSCYHKVFISIIKFEMGFYLFLLIVNKVAHRRSGFLLLFQIILQKLLHRCFITSLSSYSYYLYQDKFIKMNRTCYVRVSERSDEKESLQ